MKCASKMNIIKRRKLRCFLLLPGAVILLMVAQRMNDHIVHNTKWSSKTTRQLHLSSTETFGWAGNYIDIIRHAKEITDEQYQEITNEAEEIVKIPNNSPSSGFVKLWMAEKEVQELARTKDNLTKLVLVTQYRGGSSFLGQIFNSNKKGLYWFEPLIFLRETIKRYNGLQNPDGSPRKLPYSFLNTLRWPLHNILDCRFNVANSTGTHLLLAHEFVTKMPFSTKLKPFRNCLGRNITRAHLQVCSQTVLTRVCQNSKVRVIKTIRIMLYMVEAMLKKDPDIVFLLYVRDPRGIILSRMDISPKFKSSAPKAVIASARMLCLRMQHDYETYQRLSKLYPRNFFTLKYEDLAQAPEIVTTYIHQKLGIEVTVEVMAWVIGNTRKKKISGLMGTSRDSVYTSNRWKKDLAPDLLSGVTSVCMDLLNVYGYPTKNVINTVNDTDTVSV